MNAEAVNAVVDVLATSMLVPVLLFVFLYTTRSPWWVTDLGVAALSSKLSQLLVFVVIGLSLYLGQHYPGREYVRLFGYAPVVVMAWFDVANLMRYQKAFPDGRRNAGKRPGAWTLLKRYFRPPID